ncbi:thioredoxin family protein [Paenibacillus tarimensis]|uniref:thioredoxin family protein n=1 Tax=Paenibacillus tarimensis TaxID=416012 RepID=UPI001F3B46A5|nr:thioredoxin family protein [Paenibacillus tarimensis]MCF2944621.1 thioredoxin family protein [Paenibacillus tarimensis]
MSSSRSEGMLEALEELREAELLESDVPSIERYRKQAVLFISELCGTCRVAEKMVQVAVASGLRLPVRKMGIAFAPVLRQRWQIASVPCLVMLENGSPVDRLYAMGSVDHIYIMLKRFEQAGS